MAGDWIKVEHATPDKPEVVQLSNALGIDQDAVVGKLIRLWIWADLNTVDGNAVSVTESFLDRYTFCPGFAAALRKVGWLDGRESRLSIPNFSRHNGQTAKQRGNSLKRVKKYRENCNAASVTKPLPETEKEIEKSIKEKEPRLSSEVTWPEELQTAEFADAWDLWKRHRLQKQKPLGSIEEESQLYDLARFGWQEAVQIVRYSISVGAKNLITNGDHAADKRARAPNQPRHRSRVPSLEEGSL